MSNSLEELLVGKPAFITGASRGVGRSIVEKLSTYKMKLGLLARSREKLESTAEHARAKGCETLTLYADLRKRDELEKAVGQFKEQFGVPKLLINNAGIGDRRYWAELSADEELDIMAVNYSAPVLLTRLFLPAMLKKKEGSHIININSVAGLYASPYAGAYGASKAALLAYFTSLAYELESTSVKTSSLFSGPIDTEFISRSGFALFKDRKGMLKPGDVATRVLETIKNPRERVFANTFFEQLAIKLAGLNPPLFRGIIERKNPLPLKK
jgi:short-subunit dehydrogenase